jgi:hypothetical protein
MRKIITVNTKVAQKKKLPVVDLDGEIALMNTEKGHYYSLDSIGSRIWTIMADEIAISDLIAVLLVEYEVSPEVCERDVTDLIRQLNDQGLIDVS